jgi:hypothetical protein
MQSIDAPCYRHMTAARRSLAAGSAVGGKKVWPVREVILAINTKSSDFIFYIRSIFFENQNIASNIRGRSIVKVANTI